MSSDQLTAFVQSLSEAEAVEWDLLLSNGVPPHRARNMIVGARMDEPLTVKELLEGALQGFDKHAEVLHEKLQQFIEFHVVPWD